MTGAAGKACSREPEVGSRAVQERDSQLPPGNGSGPTQGRKGAVSSNPGLAPAPRRAGKGQSAPSWEWLRPCTVHERGGQLPPRSSSGEAEGSH